MFRRNDVKSPLSQTMLDLRQIATSCCAYYALRYECHPSSPQNIAQTPSFHFLSWVTPSTSMQRDNEI